MQFHSAAPCGAPNSPLWTRDFSHRVIMRMILSHSMTSLLYCHITHLTCTVLVFSPGAAAADANARPPVVCGQHEICRAGRCYCKPGFHRRVYKSISGATANASMSGHGGVMGSASIGNSSNDITAVQSTKVPLLYPIWMTSHAKGDGLLLILIAECPC